MTFFEELKRRKVYRVAIVYAVAAGGIIQLASAVFPAWELPNWALRFVVVLLLLGFPIALILAWAFDVTPQGIQATPPLPTSGSALSAMGHRQRNIFLLGVAGLAAAVAAGFLILPHLTAKRMEKSIAVLPFENLSAEQENAYFADGIQDDILTSLAKIGDLKVISRTSVMGYRGNTRNVREIGKALGVGAVLEGSVRREGKRVRVNVQLIDTATDEHLWAEDYDRDLTDVFAIQTDLAQKIAKELRAQLSPSEKEQIMRRPTENGEAYLAFVEAHNLNWSEDMSKLKQAAQLYERAIQLDPKFALAMANLSMLYSWIYHNNEPTDAQRALAEQYADRALALAPDSPEAHLARGYFLYYGQRNYEGALHEFDIAQRGLPNDAVYLVIGAIQRRQGKWKESTDNLEKAVSLNPNDTWPLQNLFFNYQMQRDFEAANRVIDRALVINPKSFSLWELRAKLAFAERGDLTVAEKSLAELEQEKARGGLKDLNPETVCEMALAQATVLLFRQKYPEALEVLHQLSPETLTANSRKLIEASLLEGILRTKIGQTAEARAALLKAKESAEAMVRAAPNDAPRHAVLARTLAYLGEKDAAIAEAKRATGLLPESVDAFSGPAMTQTLAEVYAVTGENAKAIELLAGLLSRPSEVTVATLKIDPSWDALRNDPAFQNLLSKD